jgi:hypothetical protein
MDVGLTKVKETGAALTYTMLAELKLVPVKVTVVPPLVDPAAGETVVMVGGAP